MNAIDDIQITQTTIHRNSKGLKDWQVEKVTKDYEAKEFYLYPKKGGKYSNYISYANIKSEAYEKAFQDQDWKYFDSEFDTAITFDWIYVP